MFYVVVFEHLVEVKYEMLYYSICWTIDIKRWICWNKQH